MTADVWESIAIVCVWWLAFILGMAFERGSR